MATASTSWASAQRRSTEATAAEVAGLLQDVLTRRLTAFIAGVDGKTISRWATGEVATIRDLNVEQRLRAAYAVARMLLEWGSPQTVRAWFIGLNPHLDDSSPASALRDGNLQEVIAAARIYVAGG